MKHSEKRMVVPGILALLVIALSILAYRYDMPAKVEPSPDWGVTVASLDAAREHVLIQSGRIQLEGDLLLPAGGQDVKSAVIFVTGSGSNTYQAYE